MYKINNKATKDVKLLSFGGGEEEEEEEALEGSRSKCLPVPVFYSVVVCVCMCVFSLL